MSKQIVVFPRGQLTPKEKEHLTKNGFLAIECDDPKGVRVLSSEAWPIGSNAMLLAALEAMCGSSGDQAVRSRFTMNLLESIKKQGFTP